MRLCLSIALCLIVSQVSAAAAADFYVAPDGDDAHTGIQPAAAPGSNDGPFASLARAQAAVRELRQREPDRARPVCVQLRGGSYWLPAPWQLGPEDSGTAAAPVIYEAYPGERPVLSGGVPITGWTAAADGSWRAQLDEVARGQWSFAQLFVGGERRYRPRLPRAGYFTIAEELPPSAAAEGKGADRFRFAGEELRGDWAALGDVEVLCFHQWAMSRLRIAAIDEQERIVQFTGPTCSTSAWAKLPAGHRYLVENVREALDSPGQWYLDRAAGELIYLPLPGEEIGRTPVVAPRLPVLVRLAGDPESRRWVSHIILRGLVLAHTNWTLPPAGYSFPQAEAAMPAALEAVGARHCAVEGCAIEHINGYAIEWGAACKANRVCGCDLTDLGAGGIKIGETRRLDEDELVASHNVVEETRIVRGGRLHPAGIGVWIGHSHSNRIEHNEIGDLYYTGVSVGWSWGYGPSNAHHNRIGWNHIHTIGQRVLSDMGGIYTLGLSPGSVLHNNRIHDIDSFGYGSWGIYFDEGTTGMCAESNIVYRARTGGFHQHYGRENTVRNNVFALAREGQIIRSRAEEHLSFTFERNIVYWREGPLLGSNWSGSNYKLDRNLYWNPETSEFTFGEKTLAQWRESGQDEHSLVADPLFVDPQGDDFRLRPDSPALLLGFQPFDLAEAGPRRDFPALPAVAPAFPLP